MIFHSFLRYESEFSKKADYFLKERASGYFLRYDRNTLSTDLVIRLVGNPSGCKVNESALRLKGRKLQNLGIEKPLVKQRLFFLVLCGCEKTPAANAGGVWDQGNGWLFCFFSIISIC